ncbi:globin-coupled sensor protein [Bacillus alkalicola]|uniref:Globin-coupled sensor protein n=3 Tax=Bacillaceae TaxID=186817 RepID=A0ABS6JWI0_9BACI|nr:globin-coupled sensor protein [Bacillus alkalicola]
MMFLKGKKERLLEYDVESIGDIDFLAKEGGSSLNNQIEMIDLTKEDLAVVRALQPTIEENLKDLVDKFYKNIETESSLTDIIQDHSSFDRLKKTLTIHIREMFSGVINEEYIQKRLRIAYVHVKIGLETKWYMCSFQDLLLSIIQLIEDGNYRKADAFKAMRAVTKIFNLEQQLVLEAYDQETARIKQEAENQKVELSKEVSTAALSLAAVSEEVNASFQELQSQSEEINRFVTDADHLSTLAEGRSVKGKEHITKHHQNMSKIQHVIDEVREDVAGLLEISKQMQDIINMVTGIAEQTNLLSLNAAIEAARAGEHGKGFSVVADEVRKLSDETKKSVGNVSNLISNTNEQMDKLTDSLERIRSEVNEGNTSMEETQSHFDEILDTLQNSKKQNASIKNEFTDFVQRVNEIGATFDEVAASADKLTGITQELEEA